MASPLTMGSHGTGWMGGPPQQPQAPTPAPPGQVPAEADEYGIQVRPMGLKVHYTFDKDSQVNCLARLPQILQIQTIPLDDRNRIGVVDLRLCLQAVAECSPEIIGQQESDYTIYAYDYSEQDTPLVGQGLMSWALDAPTPNAEPKMVTGRVTKNLLAMFGNGIRETLEVKLRMTAVPRMQRADSSNTSDFLQKSAPTPTDTTGEWNSFIQSNPGLGRSANVSSVHTTPVLSAARLDNPPTAPVMMPRNESVSSGQFPVLRPAGSSAPSPRNPTEEPAAGPPAPVVSAEPEPKKPKRPSSRASRATGRPRGRPRKNPLPDGNTSAIEDATDADEGPKKKRAKTTKADYPEKAPLDAAPESLRVAASISGSLRQMRPIAAAGEGPAAASHLQEGPRAPTPVPGPRAIAPQSRKPSTSGASRRQSVAAFDSTSDFPQYDQNMLVPQSQDARSPTDSISQSPFPAYTPEDSPGDIGSSPPVPRSTQYMQSSPMASSPILPPMPMPQQDSGFMSGGIDDLFEEDEFPLILPPHPTTEGVVAEVQRPTKSNKRQAQKDVNPGNGLSFQHVNPGPPELLPSTSIFKPAGKTKALNKHVTSNKAPTQLKRANTEPKPNRPEQQEEMRGIQTAQQASSQVNASQVNMQGTTNTNVSTPAVQETIVEDNGEEPMLQPMSQQAEKEAGAQELPAMPAPKAPGPRQLSRAVSMSSAPMPMVPASDPVGAPAMPLAPTSFSEAPCPMSDNFQSSRSNKNQVKKQSIKEKLQKAIESGAMPPFCNNCGAIETPTWRKMWTQDKDGVPEFYEFSEKPGQVTAIDILERDPENKPLKYRLVKKTLGMAEDKRMWNEMLLCNPCGIWLSKFKTHRPPDRWDKDAQRLNQSRRKREPKGNNSRSKKPRTQSEPQSTTGFDGYMATDPLGPGDQGSSPAEPEGLENGQPEDTNSMSQAATQPTQPGSNGSGNSPKAPGMGSTHSRASGTAKSPIAVEDDLGTTRRLLFPSPRKDGVPKVLGEMAVNIVKTAPDFPGNKNSDTGKENMEAVPNRPVTPEPGHDDDEMVDLFGTPPARPCTPPNDKSANSGPFKTPTRPTPSHRPITRSISKSIRSARSIPKSPGQALLQLQQTPTKTPRSAAAVNALLASARRRTPRNQHLHAHFALDDDMHNMHNMTAHFDTPFTATLNQLLSEANDFTAGSPAHGLVDIDLSSLPNLDSDGLHGQLAHGALDFGNFLSTDMVMPSSPPLLGGRHMPQQVTFGGSLAAYEATNMELWTQFSETVGHDDDGELLEEAH